MLVELLTGLGSAGLEGMVRLSEAAFAWRAGRHAVAAAIAMPRAVPSDPAQSSMMDLMLLALAAASGTVVSERGALGVAQIAARQCPPAVAAQILALLAIAHPRLRKRLRELAPSLTGRTGPAADSARREVLSLDECRAILEA